MIKRPKLATAVEEALNDTPPPVVGPQSEPCSTIFFKSGYCKTILYIICHSWKTYTISTSVCFSVQSLGKADEKTKEGRYG